MTDFEFIFVLYALVLGLSLVSLLAGFGSALERLFAGNRDGDAFRLGWLTPLFAVFVLLDLMSFWIFAWVVRDHVIFNPTTTLGVMAFAAAYYLAARLVFPSQPDDFADLDTHYFRVRRVVLGILIALVFVQWAYLSSIPEIRAQISSPISIGMTAVLVGLMAMAMWVRRVRWNAVLLTLLILRYLFVYLA